MRSSTANTFQQAILGFCLILIVTVFEVTSTCVGAVLAHRYSFDDGTANDSIGGSDAVLVNNATAFNGQLVTSGGGSGQDSTTPMASLDGTDPVAGITGDFSIEEWFTRNDTLANFQTLFSLGDDQNDYILAVPQRGGDDPNTNHFGVSVTLPTSGVLIDGPTYLSSEVEHQLLTLQR